MKEILRVGLLQTVVDYDISWSLNSNHLITMCPFEEDWVWNEIKEGFCHFDAEQEIQKPQIIILPELSIPLSREYDLELLSVKLGSVVIGGLDFIVVNDKLVENRAIVLIPQEWPYSKRYGRANKLYFGKTFFSSEEKEYLKRKKKNGNPFPYIYIFDAGEYGWIGVAICSDFFDIERFVIYKGRIQHLIVISYNKDVKSYYFLAEAISRLVYCNVIICNTGYYGGSIVFSPYNEEYKRYIYKHEGSKLFTTQIVQLPVKSLIEAQKGISTKDGLFKSQPPGYHYHY